MASSSARYAAAAALAARGVKYTKDGENARTIVNKAYAFMKTWDSVLSGAEVVEKPADMTDTTAWAALEKMYGNKDRVRWAKRMAEEGLNLRSCTESDVKDFLIRELFQTDRKVNTTSYVADICSDVRGMFRAIGREHRWGGGQNYDHLMEFLVNSGNPMTTATEDALKAQVKEKKKKKKRPAAAAAADGCEAVGAVAAGCEAVGAVAAEGEGAADEGREKLGYTSLWWPCTS